MIFPSGGRTRGKRGAGRLALSFGFSIILFAVFAFPENVFAEPVSSRIANYTIDVRLNPMTNSIDGHEVISWHNTSNQSAASLCFHLYPNAFKSDNTTFMSECGRTISESARGWMNIRNLTDLRTGDNLTGGITYIRPDDGNPHDSTVMMVQLATPVRPGDSTSVSIDFHEQFPEAAGGRGWAPGTKFYFAAQWFPKIGVFHDGAWNCHQFHGFSGSFADFGFYDVKINVPVKYTVGATGEMVGESEKADGSVTYRFAADSVHDFAWTASPEFMAMTREFKYPGLPRAKVILLLQPNHRKLADRYFAAVDTAMKYFGLWYGPYPYRVLTVVDPPRTAHMGGMSAGGGCAYGTEYPTLIMAGTSEYSLRHYLSPEAVTIHAFAHQYWYGMIANNDFENAWLDEGLSSYSAGRVLEKAYGTNTSVFRIGGVYPIYLYPVAEILGVPVAALIGKVWINEPYNSLPLYLEYAKTDPISEPGYKALDRGAYRTIACSKPDLVLCTLEGVLGKDMMRKVLRTYFEQYRFSHPTPADFEKVCDQMSRQNLGWFFSQFIEGTGTVDFAVRSIDYYEETDLGTGASSFVTKVVVARNGSVKMPVDLRLSLDDGRSIDTVWAGRDRWQAFTFHSGAPPSYAVLDPENKIPIDTDYANNSLRVDSYLAPVIKWAGRILNYFQNMLLNVGVIV